MFKHIRLRAMGLLLVSVGVSGADPAIVQVAEAQVKKSLLFGIDALGFGTQGFNVASTPFMDRRKAT